MKPKIGRPKKDPPSVMYSFRMPGEIDVALKEKESTKTGRNDLIKSIVAEKLGVEKKT